MLPQMSQTEKEALDAGTVWWEGELFHGRPDWNKLLAYPQPKLTAEEQSFLDNETEELCRLSDDWVSSHYDHDLSPEAWKYMKEKGFLGMIIPKQYGGVGFSAYAHSQGGDQAVHALRRHGGVGDGAELPRPGRAAAALRHRRAEEPLPAAPRQGPRHSLLRADQPVGRLGRRLDPRPGHRLPRPVAGQGSRRHARHLGQALHHPGAGRHGGRPGHPPVRPGASARRNVEDIGITCALVPASHPGVETGRRHFPLNAAWHNGPTRGKDVFMPLEFIIGGPKMAGQGWRMLMECLAAGRSISLPASNTGMQKLAVRTVGGYARVRSQFKTAIGKFEGIQEPLARMGGNLYLCDAARVMTAGSIDLGEKPSVVSAIVKYHVTERARQSVNDGMDILGGKGICLGPSNFLGRAYQQVPVAITVEGANILTRSLIIFGQGAIRCHPYVMAEMQAAQKTTCRLSTRRSSPTSATPSATAARLLHRPYRLAFRQGAGQRRAGDAPLLPAADALLLGLRLPRRRLDAGDGRRPQAQGEALRAHGRHPLADVPLLGGAQALREPRGASRPMRR
jgi:acyl-CoA dehydrogenase